MQASSIARADPGSGFRAGRRPAYRPVEFFNTEKWYRFLARFDGEDVFDHYPNLVGSGCRTPEAGQQVEFESGPGRQGGEARNVRVI